MYENIEAMLLEQQKELYSEIKRKSVDQLGLSVNVGSKIIGFGKILDFYMFWISQRRGTVCFNARKKFTHARTDNLVSIELVKDNKDQILKAIDEIYNSYLQADINGQLSQEIRRLEAQSAVRQVIANNKKTPPPVKLLWNNVTVLAFKGLEISNDNKNVDAEDAERLRASGQILINAFEDILSIIERINSNAVKNFSIFIGGNAPLCGHKDLFLSEPCGQFQPPHLCLP